MVRLPNHVNPLIMLIMVMVQVAFSSSGNYAFQAKKYFAQGNYEVAYGQYERALGEARKEANLDAEGKILTSMATLVTRAMEYEEAKKIFGMVNVGALDNAGKEEFYRAYMEFYNLQGNYMRSFEIAKNNSFKKPSAAFLGEAAVAAAGSKNYSEASAYLKKICKNSPGQQAFYTAKVADLKGENSIELYEKALSISIEKKRYFTTGIILLRLAQITGNKDYAARSATVFLGLKLAKPFEQAEALK